MGWALIVIGVMLVTADLYSRYRFYRDRLQERENRENANLEILFERLEGIDQRLEQIMREGFRAGEKNEAADSSRSYIPGIGLPGTEQESRQGEFAELLRENRWRYTKNNPGTEHKGVGETGGRYDGAFKLAEGGLRGEQIAERLNLGVRETELLLKFQQREKNAQ